MTRRETWDLYASAWKAEGPESKREVLQDCTDANCVYRAPGAFRRGQTELIEEMLEFHRQVPGGHFLTTEFMEHHDRSMARWVLLDGEGKVGGDGVSFAEYSPEGKLVTMTGFFKTPGE